MNKEKLIEKIALAIRSTKAESEKILNCYIQTIQKTLKKGEDVNISGFGRWYVTERKSRVGKNPQTGESIKISAFKTPAFKASKLLKNALK